MNVVGVEFRFDPCLPHWPASRVSKNPKTEKSPCVIVAIATDDHNVAMTATAGTRKPRQPHTPPKPNFLFCISTPKPVGALVASSNPSSKSDKRCALTRTIPHPFVGK